MGRSGIAPLIVTAGARGDGMANDRQPDVARRDAGAGGRHRRRHGAQYGHEELRGDRPPSPGQICLGRASRLIWLHPRGCWRFTTGSERPSLLLSTTPEPGSTTVRRGIYDAARVRTSVAGASNFGLRHDLLK